MHRAISNYKITKRKDGRYYVRLQDGGDITHIYRKTKSEVQAKLEIKLEELNKLDRRRAKQAFPTRNITLANWAHLCLNTFCASTISGNTYVGYERYIRLHFGKLGDMPISKITNIMVQEHINQLSHLGRKDGMSEAYLTRVKVFLHMIFNYAVQNNLIVVNPTLGVKIPKIGLNENRALTQEGELRLLAAVRDFNKPFMFIVVVALYTGCRKGELFALKWRHIDFEPQDHQN
jgi:integrase